MNTNIETINIIQKFSLFSEPWNPKIIAELNGQHVKLARLKGEFTWHKHEHEDELFLVISGTLSMELRDKTLEIQPNELIVIPRGVEHKPVAQGEVLVLLFEPAGTLNTGDQSNELTQQELDWI